jgi:hypothetical protein
MMSQDVRKIIGIVGTALLLTIVLRYYKATQGLITTGTTAATQLYRAVSLVDAPVPQ